MRNAYRYGVICALALGMLVVSIVASGSAGSRALIVLLAGATLGVATATSNSPERARRQTTFLVAGVLAITSLLAVFDVLGPGLAAVAAGVFATLTILVITGGMGRLVNEHGVTLQAVAGGLAIYVLVGLVFGCVVEVIAHYGNAAYFANGEDGNFSDHIYYSFTVLTTTGLGDFSPATQGGRALATLEMLFGQIYLVTVVAILVANIRRGRAETG